MSKNLKEGIRNLYCEVKRLFPEMQDTDPELNQLIIKDEEDV